MHKHLKQPLIPADHINTELSAGIGEVIDVAMAKKREERYQSTADMLEDLRLVRRGETPIHARRVADLDQLAKMEESKSGETIDIVPESNTARLVNVWGEPVVIGLAIAVGVSVLLNIGLIILYILKK